MKHLLHRLFGPHQWEKLGQVERYDPRKAPDFIQMPEGAALAYSIYGCKDCPEIKVSPQLNHVVEHISAMPIRPGYAIIGGKRYPIRLDGKVVIPKNDIGPPITKVHHVTKKKPQTPSPKRARAGGRENGAGLSRRSAGRRVVRAKPGG